MVVHHFDNGIPWEEALNNSDIPDNSIHCLGQDSKDNLWVGTFKGLAVFNGKDWEIYDTTNSDLTSNHICCIAIVTCFHIYR